MNKNAKSTTVSIIKARDIRAAAVGTLTLVGGEDLGTCDYDDEDDSACPRYEYDYDELYGHCAHKFADSTAAAAAVAKASSLIALG